MSLCSNSLNSLMSVSRPFLFRQHVGTDLDQRDESNHTIPRTHHCGCHQRTAEPRLHPARHVPPGRGILHLAGTRTYAHFLLAKLTLPEANGQRGGVSCLRVGLLQWF
ncbi:hypothetical protein E2C01_091360 [Portunus trituberculatus]|uniref:Uncharacterized protein n=1 Tax=Portunus trituberculatus TaxID=210409 RepID=A0A5B7JMR5_PORTR|nr:hypothetical protein [Portunus trituberculatus]